MQQLALAPGFENTPDILAMGGELKSSFCLLHQGEIFLSEPTGDLEQANIFRNYCDQITRLCHRFDGVPGQIVADMHPNYLSTQHGSKLATEQNTRLIQVQHHHAHIAASLAEHHHPLHGEPVLGIALDGLGYGEDGTLWGGEFLLTDYANSRRIGHFQPIAMPGGVQAIREPWRNTWAHLQACGWNAISSQFSKTDIIRFLNHQPLDVLTTMLEKQINSPLASSSGRLFDAVAACLGIHREHVHFEGEAAIELERLASTAIKPSTEPYPFTLQQSTDAPAQLNWCLMWQALLTDINTGYEVEQIAARFHQTVIVAICEMTQHLCQHHQINTVALSGGVFQNQLLRQGVMQNLKQSDLNVLVPSIIPVHDGGLALGQAITAAARLLKSEEDHA